MTKEVIMVGPVLIHKHPNGTPWHTDDPPNDICGRRLDKEDTVQPGDMVNDSHKHIWKPCSSEEIGKPASNPRKVFIRPE